MRSALLMTSFPAGLPPGGRCSRLAVLRHLLFCEAPFPAAVPAIQEAVPGAADGRGLPAGHQPRRPPSRHLQLVRRHGAASAPPAGGAPSSLTNMLIGSVYLSS